MSYFVGHSNFFYHPKQGDIVIGIINRKSDNDWVVDIGYSHTGLLPMLSFDGATKKTCPKFRQGEMVACYIEVAPEAGEILLSCIPRTNQEKLGPLVGGSLLRCKSKDIQKVFDLGLLEKITQAKIKAVNGMNGRLFIEAQTAEISERICYAILTSLENQGNEIMEFRKQLSYIDFPTMK